MDCYEIVYICVILMMYSNVFSDPLTFPEVDILLFI